MSDDESVKLPRYEIQEIGDRRVNGHLINHSILKRKSNGILEEFMPNVGSLDNARFIVKALKYRDDENRRASEDREREFQESLKERHVFILANTRVKLCYCGKPDGDPIHITDTDENQI